MPQPLYRTTLTGIDLIEHIRQTLLSITSLPNIKRLPRLDVSLRVPSGLGEDEMRTSELGSDSSPLATEVLGVEDFARGMGARGE